LEQEEILAEDSNDCEFLGRVLFRVCEHAVEQLRETKQRAGRVELRIRYADYREETEKLKLTPPVQSSAVLYAKTLPALNLVLKRRTRVRSMHLRLTELSTGSVQLDLFADPKPERRAKLETAVDALRKRFGEAIVSRR